jgi:hypothetical protein
MRNGEKKHLKFDPKVHPYLLNPGFKRQNADLLDLLASIRRGLEQAKRGQGQSVDDVFDELERGESTFKS